MPDRPRRFGCWAILLLIAAVAAAGWQLLQREVRDHPERFFWTPLHLDQPIGPFTAMKLAGLTDDSAKCLTLLRSAGIADKLLEPSQPALPQCNVADAVRLAPRPGKDPAYLPDRLVTSCPVAAALALWEREVVQLAALRLKGLRVIAIEHSGSFACRRLYGRQDGPFSEHATADAIDITAFRFADGSRLTVAEDWKSDERSTAFLRATRDGACQLFSTVLSPEYNSAHSDHVHFDMAERGRFGGRICR